MALPRVGLALALVVSALFVAHALTDRGVIYLDDLTFEKIVDGSRDTLVRFDKEYAWGDDHDAFKELAKKVGEAGQDVLITSVPVAKRDYDPKNADLGAKFGADDEGKFPIYLIFKKGTDHKGTPIRLPAGASKKTDDLLAWVAQTTGAFFGLKGQVKELDALAREFVAAAADARKAVAARAEKAIDAAAEASKDAAKYYLKVMSKTLGAADFPATETKRLNKLLEGKLASDKRDAIQVKLNVLSSFASGGDKAAKDL